MLVRGIYREHRRSRRSTPCLAEGCRNQETAVLSHSNLQIFFLQILKCFYICSHREDVPHQHLASPEGGGVRPAARSVGRAPQRQGNAVACGGRAVSWGEGLPSRRGAGWHQYPALETVPKTSSTKKQRWNVLGCRLSTGYYEQPSTDQIAVRE